MKAVLISIKPFYVFLIIAKTQGWNIEHYKTIEVRKNFPKSDWNKIAHIYCTKDRNSFAKIPKEYQPAMEKFLGEVIGEFVCDRIEEFKPTSSGVMFRHFLTLEDTCLKLDEIKEYLCDKIGCGWHISDLKIYDNPKALSEFVSIDCKNKLNGCAGCDYKPNCIKHLKRPPQSWCYVEEME